MNNYLSTRPNQPQCWKEGLIPPSSKREAEVLEPCDVSEAPPLSAREVLPAKASLIRQLLLLAFLSLFSVSAYYAVSQYVITAVMVRGRSMTPTLQDGERYYLNRWLLHFREPKRGDVVVIRDNGHDDFAVKRIIALPGERIDLRCGLVYIGGRRLLEPYLAPDTLTYCPSTGNMSVQLGEDQYFVMGDNRRNSEDSRFYGSLQRTQIIGVLVQ